MVDNFCSLVAVLIANHDDGLSVNDQYEFRQSKRRHRAQALGSTATANQAIMTPRL